MELIGLSPFEKIYYLRSSQKFDVMGIKSFIGRRAKPGKTNAEKVKVSDYMTRQLVTFKPEQPVLEVIEILVKKNISGGPVVNDNNELVGIISEGDCLKELSDCRYYNQPMEDVKVEKHMIKQVDTIDGDMNVLDAANKFLESKHRRFPILENGKLVGQISQRDVLCAALKLKGQTW